LQIGVMWCLHIRSLKSKKGRFQESHTVHSHYTRYTFRHNGLSKRSPGEPNVCVRTIFNNAVNWITLHSVGDRLKHWRNDTGENYRYLDRNLSQCHFAYNRPYMDRPGIEPGPP